MPVSPDGYTLLGKEAPEALLGKEAPEAPLKGKEAPEAPLKTKTYNYYSKPSDDGYVGDSGYEYDYQEAFFEPANEEEALLDQLNMKLAVTEIPREEIESVVVNYL